MLNVKGLNTHYGQMHALKGVEHLDPGAVTMSYQIEVFVDYILSKLS